MKKSTKIIYYIITGFLCLQMLVTGVGDVLMAEQIVENITRVGFSAGMIPFLGILKIMGALVLLFVRNFHLKIATYSGMFFFGLGAVYSHIAIGDPIVPGTLPAVFLLTLIISSYYLWQKHNYPIWKV